MYKLRSSGKKNDSVSLTFAREYSNNIKSRTFQKSPQGPQEWIQTSQINAGMAVRELVL